MEINNDEKARILKHLAHSSLTLTLQTFAQVGQAEIARALSISDSTVSRIKSERLEEVVNVLAACGLKIVPQDYHGDHCEYIDAALVFACYGIKALRKDQHGGRGEKMSTHTLPQKP